VVFFFFFFFLFGVFFCGGGCGFFCCVGFLCGLVWCDRFFFSFRQVIRNSASFFHYPNSVERPILFLFFFFSFLVPLGRPPHLPVSDGTFSLPPIYVLDARRYSPLGFPPFSLVESLFNF